MIKKRTQIRINCEPKKAFWDKFDGKVIVYLRFDNNFNTHI